MRIAYIVDHISPHAWGWISQHTKTHEILVVSSRGYRPVQLTELAGFDPDSRSDQGNYPLEPTPHGLGATLRGGAKAIARRSSWSHPILATGSRLAVAPIWATRATRAIRAFRPDIVHAMRIPFEGIVAQKAVQSTPLIVSIWGNDFTLHADKSPAMTRATDRVLCRADGLHADCRRNLELAKTKGFDASLPGAILPSGGGIDLRHSRAARDARDETRSRLGIPPFAPLVINPRGPGACVHTQAFIEASRLLLEQRPDVRIVGVGLAKDPRALKLTARLGPRFIPTQPLERFQVLRLMGASDVLVNPTTHDGTPNSLLEAMSMGLFPVCGEVQSIREWIANGENGLITTTSPHTLGKGMLHAIQDAGLRRKAAQTNARLVAAYAEKEEVARIAQEFYKAVLSA